MRNSLSLTHEDVNSLGAAFSESAAGCGRLRAAAVESAAVSVVVRSCLCRVGALVGCRDGSMVVRFVCVIRVPLCARVSRVCSVCDPAPPGERVQYRYSTGTSRVCPGSPGVFLPVRRSLFESEARKFMWVLHSCAPHGPAPAQLARGVTCQSAFSQ